MGVYPPSVFGEYAKPERDTHSGSIDLTKSLAEKRCFAAGCSAGIPDPLIYGSKCSNLTLSDAVLCITKVQRYHHPVCRSGGSRHLVFEYGGGSGTELLAPEPQIDSSLIEGIKFKLHQTQA